tara:strand:- start:413 stop:574 length:162 start_codon:yes stop_codon:yes gene_type:complete
VAVINKMKLTKSKGLGDTIAKITKATGLNKLAPRDCGCKKRQSKLNKIFPYKK